MKTLTVLAIAIALSLGVVDGKPERVKVSDLPAAVVNAIKQRFPDGKMDPNMVLKEDPGYGRPTYYTVSVMVNGQQWVISVEENGKVRSAATPFPGR